MIIAVAGRRVDAADEQQPRFPASNVDSVRTRVRELLEDTGAVAVVSSAACGADLIALAEAGRLGLRRRVILPFEPVRFRESSVTDRPGDWGYLYDATLDAVQAAGDLVVLPGHSDQAAYASANHAILEEAGALARFMDQPLAALLVWDGVRRGDQDLTEEFGFEAKARRLRVLEVRTI